MGYRSDVAAVFYVSTAKHFPMLKLWLTENFPMREFEENIRWFDRGMVFKCEGTKWYGDYPEVKAFDTAVESYEELVKDFDDSQVEDQPTFCYEFIRVGESYDDIEDSWCGDGCESILGVERKITVEV